MQLLVQIGIKMSLFYLFIFSFIENCKNRAALRSHTPNLESYVLFSRAGYNMFLDPLLEQTIHNSSMGHRVIDCTFGLSK